MLIEERPIVCAVGVANDRVFRHNRMNFADPDRSKQTIANRMPFTIWLELAEQPGCMPCPTDRS